MQSNGAWAGIDLGADNEAVVTEIRYCPRRGFASRMNGGRFQGSNTYTFTNAVTLYTITGEPVEETLTSFTVSISTAFRYLRYIGPDGGYCNVAEVQFFGRTAGTISGLEDMRQTDTLHLKSPDGAIYDMSGRKIVSGKYANGKLPKGFYIHNGHKLIVK